MTFFLWDGWIAYEIMIKSFFRDINFEKKGGDFWILDFVI